MYLSIYLPTNQCKNRIKRSGSISRRASIVDDIRSKMSRPSGEVTDPESVNESQQIVKEERRNVSSQYGYNKRDPGIQKAQSDCF